MSYTVTCVSLAGQVSGSASGAGSPIVVTGLQGGTPYSCYATETNAIGTSGPSGSTEVIYPAASERQWRCARRWEGRWLHRDTVRAEEPDGRSG